MCDPTAAGSASIEENDLSTCLKLLKECKTVALRIFTRHKDMFPQGLLQLSSLDPTVANGPLHCKIEFLRAAAAAAAGAAEEPEGDCDVMFRDASPG